jgi:hypothetical protein
MPAFHLLLVALILHVAASAGAAPIAVPDASFDEPDVADGARANALNSDASTVPGWLSVFSGPGVSGGGVEDPLDAQFVGADGDGSPLPAPADGGQALFVQGTLASNDQSFSTLAPVAIVAEDTTYTLTVAIGNALDSEPGDVVLAFFVNGTPVAETIAPEGTLADGAFTDIQLELTTGAGDPLAGGELDIQLRQEQTANALQIAYFDDVRLEDSAVPEPAAILLLAAGAGILGGAARRRRPQP